MRRTVESIINEMEATGIMMRDRIRPKERKDELLKFQSLVCREVFNDDHAETLRYTDVIHHFRELAAQKGLSEAPAVIRTIQDLSVLGTETGIAVSGEAGELRVVKAMRNVRRPVITIPNVTLAELEGDDGTVGHRTELDQVVITDSGILLLEVKNYSRNVLISESGQVSCANVIRQAERCLGEQMNFKRYLFTRRMKEYVAQSGCRLPLYMETRVVFSNPSINVTDNYKLEPYCYAAGLPHEIDAFTSPVHYTDAQMKLLADAVNAIAEQDATYPVGLDLDRIRRNFAEALVLLEVEQTGSADEGVSPAAVTVPETVQQSRIETVEPVPAVDAVREKAPEELTGSAKPDAHPARTAHRPDAAVIGKVLPWVAVMTCAAAGVLTNLIRKVS